MERATISCDHFLLNTARRYSHHHRMRSRLSALASIFLLPDRSVAIRRIAAIISFTRASVRTLNIVKSIRFGIFSNRG